MPIGRHGECIFATFLCECIEKDNDGDGGDDGGGGGSGSETLAF
jgi:hypothetical protein